MSNPKCLRCGTTDDLTDVLFDPYDDRGETFDGVLCEPCVNEVAGREIYA